MREAIARFQLEAQISAKLARKTRHIVSVTDLAIGTATVACSSNIRTTFRARFRSDRAWEGFQGDPAGGETADYFACQGTVLCSLVKTADSPRTQGCK